MANLDRSQIRGVRLQWPCLLRRVELYYDDADRLIAVNNVNGTKTMRWHYHHLGSQPIAANREVVVGTSTTVARFWFIFDERGPIHRALDQNGLEHCRAHYDAFGWHTVDVQATDMWLPVLARPARRSPSTTWERALSAARSFSGSVRTVAP